MTIDDVLATWHSRSAITRREMLAAIKRRAET
jgi:hypothetical protein